MAGNFFKPDFDEETVLAFKKIKKYECEMLNDRGYKVKQQHFAKYYNVTKNFSWYVRVSFNVTDKDIQQNINEQRQNGTFIDYDRSSKVIIDTKGVILCYEETYENIINPPLTAALNVNDIEVEAAVEGQQLTEKTPKYKINTGLFVDTLILYSNLQSIEKTAITNMYYEIHNNYVKILKSAGKKDVFEFDIDNKNLNIMLITPDVLNNPTDLLAEIKQLVKNVEYFKHSELMFNVSKHVMVPAHIRMNTYELSKLLGDLKIEDKNTSKELPLLKKEDRVARHYLFTKSNVIKIRRPSFVFPDRYVNYYRYVL